MSSKLASIKNSKAQGEVCLHWRSPFCGRVPCGHAAMERRLTQQWGRVRNVGKNESDLDYNRRQETGM